MFSYFEHFLSLKSYVIESLLIKCKENAEEAVNQILDNINPFNWLEGEEKVKYENHLDRIKNKNQDEHNNHIDQSHLFIGIQFTLE